MDNVNSQAVTDELKQALRVINTEISFLPINSTHNIQPLDTEILKHSNVFGVKYGRNRNGSLLRTESD